jgi:putative endonuclease
VGTSYDPEKRLVEHNSGKTLSMKGYRPWKLSFTEEVVTRLQAREREKYWKSGSEKEKIKLECLHLKAWFQCTWIPAFFCTNYYYGGSNNYF